MRRAERGAGRALVAIAAALLLHVAFLALLLLLSRISVAWPEAKPVASRQAVSLRPLTSQEWAQNRTPKAFREGPERQAPIKKAQPRHEETPKGQVVDVAPGNDRESKDSKYLAEHSNQVQHETRAKNTTPFYRNAMPRTTTTVPRSGSGQAEREQVAGNNGVGVDDRPLRQPGARRPMMEVPDVKPRQEVAMRDPLKEGPGIPVQNRSESEAIRGNSQRLKVQRGQPGGEQEGSEGRRGAPGVANLTPSQATLDKVTGGAPNDHLDDVDEGDGTFLNTKEWKFASFFNRVKQAVGMHWNPGEELRTRDPTLNIYGGRDRYTILDVRLTDRGMVKEIRVEKSCGVDFLDSEAIAAFQRSQPFPNPPPGLVGADATIHFQFGFFLEMGGGPRLRLFREPN